MIRLSKIILTAILFSLTTSLSSCKEKGKEEPPPPPVAESNLLASFDSKFNRYERGSKFIGQTSSIAIVKHWCDTVWRNDRTHKQIVVWSKRNVDNMEILLSDLVSGSNQIPAAQLRLRFGHYIKGDVQSLLCGEQGLSRREVELSDGLSDVAVKNVSTTDPVKVWLTIDVPKNTVPGRYTGEVRVMSGGSEQQKLTLEFLVTSHTLPDAKDWSYHLDIWQFPFQLAKLAKADGYSIDLFSDTYFSMMEPFYRKLADAGQRTITTYIKDGALNKGETMVNWTRKTNGEWAFDYTSFDRFVTKMIEWGIDRQISCFSLVGWSPLIGYFDEASGSNRELNLAVSSTEYATVWNTFLNSFAQHLKQKGWFEKTVLYMDEIKEEDMKTVIRIIQQNNSQWKIGLAGGELPAEIESELYDYSTIIGYDRKSMASPVATFYTSCSQKFPNNYISLQSDPAEMSWMSWHVAAKGLGGYLRWAYDYWTKGDPTNSQDATNTAGDFNLVYRMNNSPNNQVLSSMRFELLREGIQFYEKVRLLNHPSLKQEVARFTESSAQQARSYVIRGEQLVKHLSVSAAP